MSDERRDDWRYPRITPAIERDGLSLVTPAVVKWVLIDAERYLEAIDIVARRLLIGPITHADVWPSNPNPRSEDHGNAGSYRLVSMVQMRGLNLKNKLDRVFSEPTRCYGPVGQVDW